MKSEKVTIKYTHKGPFSIESNATETDYNELNILTPNINTVESFPVIIMIPGDNSHKNMLDVNAKQYLKQGFAVIQMSLDEVNFQQQYYFMAINETINFIHNTSYLDNDNIALFGHSRGSHYAFIYSALYPERIKGVVCANMGPEQWLYSEFCDQYFEYLLLNGTINESEYLLFHDTKHLINGTYYLSDLYISPILNNTLPNLLITLDKNDRFDVDLEINIFLEPLQLLPNQTATSDTNFIQGKARRLLSSTSLFFHGSGLYDYRMITIQINWFKHCFSIFDEDVTTTDIFLNLLPFYILALITIWFGIYILHLIIAGLPLNWKLIHSEKKIQEKDQDENLTQVIPSETDNRNKIIKYFLIFYIPLLLYEIFDPLETLYYNYIEYIPIIIFLHVLIQKYQKIGVDSPFPHYKRLSVNEVFRKILFGFLLGILILTIGFSMISPWGNIMIYDNIISHRSIWIDDILRFIILIYLNILLFGFIGPLITKRDEKLTHVKYTEKRDIKSFFIFILLYLGLSLLLFIPITFSDLLIFIFLVPMLYETKYNLITITTLQMLIVIFF